MVETDLSALIAQESRRPVFPAAIAMVDHLKQTYGSEVQAVVFYGSCLRQNTDVDLILDFYVLVDKLNPALSNPVSAFFCALLPPNVYYHELSYEDRVVRAKVAVMAVGAFVRQTAESTFASALWARFAQPAAITYAANEKIRSVIEKALARAVTALFTKTLPLMAGPFTVRDLWVKAFRATYRAELRPESQNKADELVDADLARYGQVGGAALSVLGVDPYSPRFVKPSAIWIWRLRGGWGRLLNGLRLIKAAFTFRGGLDYAAWKLARHSDDPVELTDEERARPLRTALKLLARRIGL